MDVRTIAAGQVSVAYLTYGSEQGWPCVLAHGQPCDVHAYADVAPRLATAGAFVVPARARATFGRECFVPYGRLPSHAQARVDAIQAEEVRC